MMLSTTHTPIPSHAPVEEFSLLRTRVLCGKPLRDIRTLQESIARYGLLTPIIIIERGSKLIVVDGRKRLAAIKRLRFEGRLPRSLSTVPYLIACDIDPIERRAPILVSNATLYAALVDRFEAGTSVQSLTEHFRISHQCVRDVLTLSRLAHPLRTAFFNKMISFAQVCAFAALPDHKDQVAQFRRLGPFATPSDILERQGQPAQGRALAA